MISTQAQAQGDVLIKSLKYTIVTGWIYDAIWEVSAYSGMRLRLDPECSEMQSQLRCVWCHPKLRVLCKEETALWTEGAKEFMDLVPFQLIILVQASE